MSFPEQQMPDDCPRKRAPPSRVRSPLKLAAARREGTRLHTFLVRYEGTLRQELVVLRSYSVHRAESGLVEIASFRVISCIVRPRLSEKSSHEPIRFRWSGCAASSLQARVVSCG